jgi:hypothetical protein
METVVRIPVTKVRKNVVVEQVGPHVAKTMSVAQANVPQKPTRVCSVMTTRILQLLLFIILQP